MEMIIKAVALKFRIEEVPVATERAFMDINRVCARSVTNDATVGSCWSPTCATACGRKSGDNSSPSNSS
jgi:hypothetical protein